ncbi:MAG: hypothetical protein ABSG23_04420 [Terriglobales bacterium]
MSKSRGNTSFLPLDDALFAVKPRKPVLAAKSHRLGGRCKPEADS